MSKVLGGVLKTMRPHQWVKNLFVLAPLVFAQELFDLPVLIRAGLAFTIFCLAAGAVYILNDLVDVEADRAHPKKSKRPIASGRVSESQAKIAIVSLAAFCVAVGAWLSLGFLGATVAYLVLNLAYSFGLKKKPYIDVFCIAAGFELRVLAGAFATQISPSIYLLLITFLLASFLGYGKRLHELEALRDANHATRSVLKAYNYKILRALLWVSGLLTVATYLVYTLDPSTAQMFGTTQLVWSTIFTLFGVVRFAQLVQRHGDAESPTDAMLHDWPFLANLAAWVVVVLGLIYFTR